MLADVSPRSPPLLAAAAQPSGGAVSPFAAAANGGGGARPGAPATPAAVPPTAEGGPAAHAIQVSPSSMGTTPGATPGSQNRPQGRPRSVWRGSGSGAGVRLIWLRCRHNGGGALLVAQAHAALAAGCEPRGHAFRAAGGGRVPPRAPGPPHLQRTSAERALRYTDEADSPLVRCIPLHAVALCATKGGHTRVLTHITCSVAQGLQGHSSVKAHGTCHVLSVPDGMHALFTQDKRDACAALTCMKSWHGTDGLRGRPG